ncbi:serine-rich adhesin for platelets-like isoform X2 [Littorina saxatilis]|uniref:serine-rich adhesin for platelets-like isoform X2 n=1 Tax=Littorina saxatilis TaxID=31220 RepID=UPI0038B549CF
MASLQGQMAGGDVSDVIYSQIMNMSSSCPRSKRSSSAKSVGISFPAAPRNRSRSKTSPGNNQASYTDFDILKSRSWSESKLRSTSPVKTSALGRNTQRSSRSLLVSPALPRSALVSLTTRSATAVSYTTQHSTTVTRTACGSRGLTTPRRGLACGGSLTFGMKESALQAGATQIDRLQQEWAALEHCRAMKRASEMVQHRLNPMYRLSGSPVPLLQRYEVDDMELQRLREMTETNRTLQHDLKRMKANMHDGMEDVTHLSQEESDLLECSSSMELLYDKPVNLSEHDTRFQHSWSSEYMYPMHEFRNDYYRGGGDRREWRESEGAAFNLIHGHRQGGTLTDTERTTSQNISDSNTALSPYQLSELDRDGKLNPGAAREGQTQANCWAERQTATDSCPSNHSQNPVNSLSPESATDSCPSNHSQNPVNSLPPESATDSCPSNHSQNPVNSLPPESATDSCPSNHSQNPVNSLSPESATDSCPSNHSQNPVNSLPPESATDSCPSNHSQNPVNSLSPESATDSCPSHHSKNPVNSLSPESATDSCPSHHSQNPVNSLSPESATDSCPSHHSKNPVNSLSPESATDSCPSHHSQNPVNSLSPESESEFLPVRQERPVITPVSQERPVITPVRQEKPVITPAIQERPVITPVSQKRPVITPVRQEKPVIIPVIQERPVITPVSQERPVITPVRQEKPVITPVIQERPVITPVSQERPVITPVRQEKPVIIPVIQERPVITPVSQERPVITPVRQERPVITPVRQERPVITPVRQERPVITPVIQEWPVITPARQERPVITPVRQAKPVITPVRQERPVITPVIQEWPVITPARPEKIAILLVRHKETGLWAAGDEQDGTRHDTNSVTSPATLGDRKTAPSSHQSVQEGGTEQNTMVAKNKTNTTVTKTTQRTVGRNTAYMKLTENAQRTPLVMAQVHMITSETDQSTVARNTAHMTLTENAQRTPLAMAKVHTITLETDQRTVARNTAHMTLTKTAGRALARGKVYTTASETAQRTVARGKAHMTLTETAQGTAVAWGEAHTTASETAQRTVTRDKAHMTASENTQRTVTRDKAHMTASETAQRTVTRDKAHMTASETAQRTVTRGKSHMTASETTQRTATRDKAHMTASETTQRTVTRGKSHMTASETTQRTATRDTAHMTASETTQRTVARGKTHMRPSETSQRTVAIDGKTSMSVTVTRKGRKQCAHEDSCEQGSTTVRQTDHRTEGRDKESVEVTATVLTPGRAKAGMLATDTERRTGAKNHAGMAIRGIPCSPKGMTGKATGGMAAKDNITNNALCSPQETISKETGGKATGGSATEGNITNNALYSPQDTTSKATGGKATGGSTTEGNIQNNALCSPQDTTGKATGGKATGGSTTEGNIQNNALCSPQDKTGKATGGKLTGVRNATKGSIQNNTLCSSQDTTGKATGGKATRGNIQHDAVCSPQERTAGRSRWYLTGKHNQHTTIRNNAHVTSGNSENTVTNNSCKASCGDLYSRPKDVILKNKDLFSSVQECIKNLEVVIENVRRQNKGREAADTGQEQVKPDNQGELTSGVKSVEETEVDMIEKSEINMSEESETDTAEESETNTGVWYETNMTEGCEENPGVSDGGSDKSDDDFIHDIFTSNYFLRTSDLHCPEFVESETKVDPQPMFDEHYTQFCRTTPQRDPQGGGGVPSPTEFKVQHFLTCVQAARQNRGTGAGGRPTIEFFHLKKLPPTDQGLENTSSSNCGNKSSGLSADSKVARLNVRSRRTRLGRRSSKQKEIDANELSAQSDGANTRNAAQLGIADPQVQNLIGSLVCVPSGQAVSGEATPSVVPADDMTCAQPVSPVSGLCGNVSISPPISLHHRSPPAIRSCAPASGGGHKTDTFELHTMNPAHSDLDDKLLDQKEPSGTEREQLTFLTDWHGERGPRVDRKSQDASTVVGVELGDPSRSSRHRDEETPHDKYTGRAEKAWCDGNTVEHCQVGEEIERCRKQVLESEWCTQLGEACHSSTTLLTTSSDHSRQQAQRPQSQTADFSITRTGFSSQRQASRAGTELYNGCQDESLWFQVPQSKTDSCAQNAQIGAQSPAEVSASKKNLTDMALPHGHIVHRSIPYKSQHFKATLMGRPALLVNRQTRPGTAVGFTEQTLHDLEGCANKDIGHTNRFERADSRAEGFPWGRSGKKEADSREVSSDRSVSSGRSRPVPCRCHSDSRKAGRTSRMSPSPTRRSPHTEFLATLLELQSGQGTDTESCSTGTVAGCQQSVSESDLPLDLGVFSRESASSNKSGLVAFSNETQTLTSACSLCCAPGESSGGLLTVASTCQTELCLPLDWGDSLDGSSACSVRDHECLDPLGYVCLAPKETGSTLQYLEEPGWRAGLTRAWVKEGGQVIIAACPPELDTQEYRCAKQQSLAGPFPSPNSSFRQESDGQSLTLRPGTREQPHDGACGVARKLQLVEECIDMSRDFSHRVDSLVERLGKRQQHNQADTIPHRNRGRSVNSREQWRNANTVSCFVTAMGEASSRCPGSAPNHGSDTSTLSTGPVSNNWSLSTEHAGDKGSSPYTGQTIDRGSNSTAGLQGSRSIISTVQAYNRGLTICSGQSVTSGSDSPQGQTRNRYISARQASNTSSISPDRTASVVSSSEARKTTNKVWTCDSSSDDTERCVSRGGISQGPEAGVSVTISYLHNWDQPRSCPLEHERPAVQLVSGQPSYQQKPLGRASGQKPGGFTSRHNPGRECGVPGVGSLQFCQQTDLDDCSFSVEKLVLCPPRKTSNKIAATYNSDTLAHLEKFTSKHQASGRPVWNNNFMKGVSLDYRPRYHRPQSAGVGTVSRRKMNEAAGGAEFGRRTRSASWSRAESVSKMTASGAHSHTCTLMTSRQGSTQTVAKQRSLHTSTPKKSSKQSTPRKNSKQSTPRKNSKQSTPRKNSKQSTPRKGSKQSTPRKRSKQSTPRKSSKESTSGRSSNQSISRKSSNQSISGQSSNQLTSRKSSNQLTSKQSSHQSTSRQSSNQSTCRQRSNQSISRQSSNQSLSRQSSNKSTSRQSSNQSIYRQSSNQSIFGESSNQSTSRQSSEQSTSRQSSKLSTPRQNSNQSTPRQSSNQSTPREISKQMTSKQSSKQLTPRQNSKQITPRQSSRQITPQQSSRQISPRQNSKQITPRQSSRHITPGQSSQKLTPRQSSRQISPRQRKIKLTPRQRSGEIVQRQSSIETLQTADEENLNQSGAHTEQATNTNTCCQRKERKAQRTQSVRSSQRELNVDRQIDRSVKTRKATRSCHSLPSSHRLRDHSGRVSTPRDESVSPSRKTVGKGQRQCLKKQGRRDKETRREIHVDVLCDRSVEEPQSQYSRLMSDPALEELSPQSWADTSPPISAGSIRQDGSTDSSRFQTETQTGARAQSWTQFQGQITAQETQPKTGIDKEEQNGDLLCEVYLTSTTKKCKSRNKDRRLLPKCKRDEKGKPGGTAADIKDKVIFAVSVVKRRPDSSEDPGTGLDETHVSLTNELSPDQNGLDERHVSFYDELFSDQTGAAEKQTGIPHDLLDDVHGYTWSGRQTGLVLDARHAIVSGIDYNKPTDIKNMKPTDSNYWKPTQLHIHLEEAKKSQEPDNTCVTRKREDHDLVCGAQGDDPYFALNKRGNDHELAGVKRGDDLDFAGMERCDDLLDFTWAERDGDFPLAGFERCDNLDFTGVEIVDDLDFTEVKSSNAFDFAAVENSDNYDSSCVEESSGQEEHWDDESELDSTGSDMSPMQRGNPVGTLLEEINDHFQHLIQPKKNRMVSTEISQEDLVTPRHVETETEHNMTLFERDGKRMLAIISPRTRLNKSVSDGKFAMSSADMTSSIRSRDVISRDRAYGYKTVLLRKSLSELPSREARNRKAKSSAVSASPGPLAHPGLLTQSRKSSQSKLAFSQCHGSPSVKHECSADHCDLDFLHPVTVPPPLLSHRGDVNSAEDFLSDTCHDTKPSYSPQALSIPQHEIPMTAADDKQLQGARYYDDSWHWRGQCLMPRRQSRVSRARQRMISAVLQPLAGGPSPSRDATQTQSYGRQLLPQLKRSLVHPSYGIVGTPVGTRTPS